MNKWIKLIVLVCLASGLFLLFAQTETEEVKPVETETMSIDAIPDTPEYVYNFDAYVSYADSSYYYPADSSAITKSGRKYTMYRRGSYTTKIEWYEDSDDCYVEVLSSSDINTQVATFGSVD